MKNIVIGTAGHVDHGKTSLIKILTGMDTDSLFEEKRRGISIDLGFAFFDLPSGRRAGVVDVPGHEKFIKNMLAGATGIDVVLLIIACDEGIKPQTREHIDILSMLDVKNGIVVLTKRDIVDDDWYEMVRKEVSEALSNTFLKNSKIIPFSSKTKIGYEELVQEIDKIIDGEIEKNCNGVFRLPIDRCFSINGFGTIVTGTISSGKISLNDSVTIYPKGIDCKVRNIQVHEENCETAFCGQRCALNLSGVKREDLQRGFVVSKKYALSPSYMVDCKLFSLGSLGKNIFNRQRVRFFHGTNEIIGRVHLLDKLELENGSEAYAQFHLEKPIVCLKDDRFVIRNYSPMSTIGGGYIINPLAGRIKGNRDLYLEKLKIMEKEIGIEYIESIIRNDDNFILSKSDLCRKYSIEETQIDKFTCEMLDNETVVVFNDGDKDYLVHRDNLENIFGEIKKILSTYHDKNKFKIGFLKEELRSLVLRNVKIKVYDKILKYFEERSLIKLISKYVSLFDFEVKFSKDDRILFNNIVEEYKIKKFIPPKISDLESKFSSKNFYDIHNYLLEVGILYKVNHEMYLLREDFIFARDSIINFIKQNGSISLKEVREILNSNRKYLVFILEHLDELRITIRNGENRILV